MRLPFIILTIAMLASCEKKENTIAEPIVIDSLEQKSYLVIPHGEDGSVIRSKLLNEVVEQSFPANKLVAEFKIKNNDELHGFAMSDRDMKSYQLKSSTMAKIVVSYSDHEEVYFLPQKIALDEITEELQLIPEKDRVLKVLPNEYLATSKGVAFYLVNVNHEDLMMNDQKFFQSEAVEYKNSFLVDSYKAASLLVDYEFYLQKLSPQAFGGKKIRCTRDLIEAGMCGPTCSYTRNIPVNDYSVAVETDLAKLGFSVKYSDKTKSVSEFKVNKDMSAHFEVELESQQTIGDVYSVEVVKTPSSTYQVYSAAYDYSNMCGGADKNVAGDLTIQSQVNFKVKVVLKGRGIELKTIKL